MGEANLARIARLLAVAPEFNSARDRSAAAVALATARPGLAAKLRASAQAGRRLSGGTCLTKARWLVGVLVRVASFFPTTTHSVPFFLS